MIRQIKMAFMLLVPVVIVSCDGGASHASYIIKNSSNNDLYIEWYVSSRDSDRQVANLLAGESISIHKVRYFGEQGETAPSFEIDSLTIKSENEDGEVIYLGVNDADWEPYFEGLLDEGGSEYTWTLDVGNDVISE